MKNTVTFLIFILPFFAIGQVKSIDDFYSKFKNNEEITRLTFSGGLIKFAASFDDEVDQSVIDKITQVRLFVSNGNVVTPKGFKELSKNLKTDSFEDLMQINAEGTKVNILIREQGKNISDVVLLVNDGEDFILISIEGKFQYSDLNDLNLNFEGGNFLKKLPDNRKSIPRA